MERELNRLWYVYGICSSGRFVMRSFFIGAIFSTVRGTEFSLKQPIEQHDGLAQEDELRPPVASLECSYPDTESRQELYRVEQSRCELGYQRSGEKCPGMGDSVSMEGFTLKILEAIAVGADGTVYSTSNERFVVKIPRFGSVCHEKAILMALAGTQGDYFPRTYEITSEISENCKARILVMEKVGDANWYSLSLSETEVPIADVFTRVESFVKALKALHFAGFAHSDLHQGNIRILSSDPSYIRIIDFGRSTSSSASDRASDYLSFVSIVGSLLWRIHDRFHTDWIQDALFIYFIHYSQSSCVDYDFWIWVFKNLRNVESTPAGKNQVQSLLVPTLPSHYAQLANSMGPGTGRLYRFPISFKMPWTPAEFLDFAPYPDSQHPKLRGIIEAQRIEDAKYPNTRPYLAFDVEVIQVGPNDDEQVLYLANKWLSNLQTDDVFADVFEVGARVLNFENFKITYRVNCDDLNSNLISFQREYWLKNLGPKLGIGPGAVWLSPAVKLPEWRSVKLGFQMSDDQYRKCAADPRSHVRYMVLDTTVPVADFIVSKSFLKERRSMLERLRVGIKLGMDLLSKLQRLHDFGVVYGKLEPTTVKPFLNNGVVEQGLSALERSFFNGEAGMGVPKKNSSPCGLSHWNIEEESRFGYRDDVLNVLLLAAWMFTGEEHSSFCLRTTRSMAQVAQWKREAFVFDSIDGGDLITKAFRDSVADDEEVVGTIRQSLGRALAVSRAVPSVDQIPDHSAIIEHLRIAYSLLP